MVPWVSEHLRLRSISLKSTALYSVSVNLNLLFFSNIIKSPEDEKYRKVKTQNKAFSSKVWSLPEAQEFLILWGWDQVWRLMIDYFCQQSDDNNNNNYNNIVMIIITMIIMIMINMIMIMIMIVMKR